LSFDSVDEKLSSSDEMMVSHSPIINCGSILVNFSYRGFAKDSYPFSDYFSSEPIFLRVMDNEVISAMIDCEASKL
jgi:hypothetical protein